jgi:hypothetical protein
MGTNHKKLNRLLVVDPNPCGKDSMNLEDLSISVELEVFNRDDDVIFYDTTTETTNVDVSSGKATRVSFIDSGDKGESFLTTHYTELGTKFNKENAD